MKRDIIGDIFLGGVFLSLLFLSRSRRISVIP